VDTRPLIPDCSVHEAAPMLAKVTPLDGAFGNEQKGMELEPDLKSPGFPKKSQRSELSPLPLKLLAESKAIHGWAL